MAEEVTVKENEDGIQYPHPLDAQSRGWLRGYIHRCQEEMATQDDAEMIRYLDAEAVKYNRLLAEVGDL